MNLSDKPCYPIIKIINGIPEMEWVDVKETGLTFRERLIIALASNPALMIGDPNTHMDPIITSIVILQMADAIIKESDEFNQN